MSTDTLLTVKDVVLTIQQRYQKLEGVVGTSVSCIPGKNGGKDRLDITVKMDAVAINDSIKRDSIWNTGRLLRKEYNTYDIDVSVQVQRD